MKKPILGVVFVVLVLGIGAVGLMTMRGSSRSSTDQPTVTAVTPPVAVEPTPLPIASPPQLDEVGPRLVSNQTSYALTLYGSGFQPRDKVVFAGAFALEVSGTPIDERHLAVRLPSQHLLPGQDAMIASVRVKHADGSMLPGQAELTVINDADFRTPYACALTPDGSKLFVVSPTSDELYRYDTRTGLHTTEIVGDGPRALAVTPDGKRLIIADEFGPDLQIVDLAQKAPVRTIPLAERPQDLAVIGDRALVTTRQGSLVDVDLEGGRVIATESLPGRQPRSVAAVPGGVMVGQLGTDDVVWLGADGGAERIAPLPGVPIFGGATQGMGEWVMGGKAPRALVYDPSHQVVFESSIGPNIGPNPQRVEVSMNSGVGVISLADHKFLHHLGLGAGVLEGLALDPKQGVLYAADIALGRVVAFDTDKLVKDPAHAVLGELKITPPDKTPLIRPAADFGTVSKSGTELQSGPRALCLDSSKHRLYSVNRLSGTVSSIDVGNAREMKLARTFDGPKMWNQKERRLGEVVFFTDVGHTAMSCDACHMEGHTSGVLYEKTHPLRIYRVSTLRGIRESPPYFTPTALPNLEKVALDVIGRNRFHNPDPTPDEIRDLATYQRDLAPVSNPNVGPDGAPRAELTLPDGHKGNAVHGLELFESRQTGCSSTICHPRPMFTADQDRPTRGRFQDVGTPIILGLRPQFQELLWHGWPPQELVGAWDVFPMLQSGAGGLEVSDGGSIVPSQAFALRAVLELPAQADHRHGGVASLSSQDKDDLLAYLLSI